jgi:zinc finger HIT domain-containing protein 1
VRPPFKLCSVCSYMGPYTCVRCGSSFCSLACNAIHKDTKCLKFAD